MGYQIKQDKILIYDTTNFNAKHILECGQVFTYEKLNENQYVVFSKNKMCRVLTYKSYVEIITDSPLYFEDYFDLKTNYSAIKQQILTLAPEFEPMLEYGSGIRILNQNPLETIVSFIISANNHIRRITNSMRFLREQAGELLSGYYSFPCLQKLKEFNEEFFVAAGLGYRAKQIVKALEQLEQFDLEKLRQKSSADLRKILMQVQGIGGKVADCVLLFAYGKRDVFPVDTWIEKIYHDLYDPAEKNREKMREILVEKFGNLSGFVQQYMFYFKRSASQNKQQ